jgi:multicomponent Na+:H+ antiporter subunit F
MIDLGLEGLDPFLASATLVIALLIAGGLLRVHAGPTVFDRLVAVSLVSVNGVALIALVGFLLGRPALFLDIALGFALLVFLLPLTLGRYFEGTGGRTDR